MNRIRRAIILSTVPGERLDLDAAEARVRAAIARRLARAEREPAKLCPACGETKPAADFARDVTRADGLDHTCRACRSAKHKARKEN